MTRALSDTLEPSTATTRMLRYEGFPLEAVLARVHAQHGADANITTADRVRRGGIGGFFAREVFQVTVTVPADADADTDTDAGERLVPLGVNIFGNDLEVIGEEPGDEPLDQFDDIDPEDIDGALGLGPVVERDTADDEIWALLAAAATATPAPAPAAAPALAATPVVAPIPAPAPVPTPAPAPAPALAAEIVAPILSSGPIASTTLVPSSSLVGTAFDPMIASRSGAMPGALPVVMPAVGSGAMSLRSRRADVNALVEQFESAPAAPALPTAGIVAVVGKRSEALDVAGRVAARLGVAADDVIVASPAADIVVPSPEDAMRLAASARFRCTPVAVVVVELAPGRAGHEWARVVLDGLRAEQVRLAADTCGILANEHFTIAALGGVDAIDLLDASAHPDPTRALALPAPIGSIDGRVACPELWAATALAAGIVEPATVNRSAVGAR